MEYWLIQPLLIKCRLKSSSNNYSKSSLRQKRKSTKKKVIFWQNIALMVLKIQVLLFKMKPNKKTLIATFQIIWILHQLPQLKMNRKKLKRRQILISLACLKQRNITVIRIYMISRRDHMTLLINVINNHLNRRNLHKNALVSTTLLNNPWFSRTWSKW